MSESDFSLDFLDQKVTPDDPWSHKRSAVRYLRDDIKAAIKIRSLWFPRLFPVLLRDISSRGALVASEKKMTKKSRIKLFLLFSDGNRFEIDAVVVHCDHVAHRYGIKFNSTNAALADHILHTQTDLNFS